MNRRCWGNERIAAMPARKTKSEMRLATLRQTGRMLWLVTIVSACGQTPPPATTVSPDSGLLNPRQVATTTDPGLHPTPVTPAELTGTRFGFRDATRDWNLNFTRYDDICGQNRIYEGNGGGVAVLDYDLDGHLDVFFTQGSRLPRKSVTKEFTNEMFRNTGQQLERVTVLTGLTSYAFHAGCAVGDIDEDGFPDLYVTAYGRSSLWHNNGDGTFQNISETSNTVVDSWSTSAVLADLNGDGLLDLFIVTYVQADDDPPKLCKSPESPTGTVMCSPVRFPALDDVLLINDGQGGFANVTRDAGIVGRDGKGLGVVAGDFDCDGILEIFIANDMTPCFLYKRMIDGDLPSASGLRIPRFDECAGEFGVALNGLGKATAAMGIAHGDYDRDGWIDLFVTNFEHEPNTLFRNLEGRGFFDMSTASRLGPPSRATLAFGTEFLDVDHDGWLDLFVPTGHVEDRSWAGGQHKMRPHLFRNERNGRFSDVAAEAGPYFTSEWAGRGFAIGDLDRDGDIDAVVCHQKDPSALLLNETPAERTSVVIKPVGRGASPRSAIGTRVTATGITPVLMRDVAGGGSFQSASALELHLGLGDRTRFDELEFTWPDGHVDRWANVTAGYYAAIEGRGIYPIAVASTRK